MVLGKRNQKTTTSKVDEKATAAQDRQDANKRALIGKFREKSEGGSKK